MTSGRPETRTRILQAARRLLEERGAAHVRMADVARAAGVSRQALYLHFGSRTGLLLALVEYVDEVEGLREVLGWVNSAPSAAAALDRMVEMQAEFYPRIDPVVRAISAARHTDEAAAVAWRNRDESRLQGCRRIVAWLRRDGVLAPEWSEEEAAELLWTATSPDTWRSLAVQREWPKSRYIARVQRLLQRLLLEE